MQESRRSLDFEGKGESLSCIAPLVCLSCTWPDRKRGTPGQAALRALRANGGALFKGATEKFWNKRS